MSVNDLSQAIEERENIKNTILQKKNLRHCSKNKEGTVSFVTRQTKKKDYF
jgi:hypothetical protein